MLIAGIPAVALVVAAGFFLQYRGVEPTSRPNVVAEGSGVGDEFISTDAPTTLTAKAGEAGGQVKNDTKKIVFPSGGEIEVTFHPASRAVSGRDLPDNIADSYLALKTKAENGDVFAALIAHRSVTICSEYPIRTQEELAKAIDQVHQTQTITINTGGNESVTPAVPTAVENLQRVYEFCDGLDDDQRESASKWLLQAADLGHPRSMKSHALRELGNTTEGRAYLRSAFDAGYYDSIGTLGAYLIESERYKFIPTNDENEYDDHSNRVLGYAYFYLYLKLAEADGKFSTRAMERYRLFQENEIDPLVYPRDRDTAISLAEEILSENENCCATLINW